MASDVVARDKVMIIIIIIIIIIIFTLI